MLGLVSKKRFRDCDGATRREFLNVGTLGLGLGAVSLPTLLESRADAAVRGQSTKDTSVVWLWLAGGPTHVETFDPKMTAPSEYRSMTGEVSSSIPGVTLGGNFPKMAGVADKLAIVRSFAHRNSGHGGGTHWLMTGYDNRNIDNGGLPARPSMGSILSRVRGANHPETGMPTYVGLSGIGSDGAAFLGPACSPFRPSGDAKRNLQLGLPEDRFHHRRTLLTSLDRIDRDVDQTGFMEGLSRFEDQAYRLLLGKAPEAFELKNEDPKIVEAYGKGLGQKMLQARRLCEAGCGFVTVSYGGWDMHGNLVRGINRRGPEVDRAVAAFVEDVHQRGLSENILLVITGEFGRTPRINKNAGRDHWSPLSALALSGGGLQMGQVVGESAKKVDVPTSKPISPQDLMATVFHVLGIDPQLQFTSPSGRPVYMLEEGQPIAELV